MKINRPEYMDVMLGLLDVPLIKIINGVRQSGKSTLLSLLAEELEKRGIPEGQIIYRRYTALGSPGVYDAVSMYDDLRARTEGKGRCYLLLDEVQEVDGWEKAVNSLFEDDGHCLYITGSSSKLLAGEFSTYISGRYVEIPVYPLSFDEFRAFRKDAGVEAYDIGSYIEYGGFPVISTGNFDSETAYQIIYGIYSSIIIRDIQRRHKVTNLDLFSRVVDFMLDNMGKTFSGASVVRFLKGQGRTPERRTGVRLYKVAGGSVRGIPLPAVRFAWQGDPCHAGEILSCRSFPPVWPERIPWYGYGCSHREHRISRAPETWL